MAVQGNILAFRFGPDVQEAPGYFGSQTRSGLQPLLAVRSILAKVQTTVLFGNSLFMTWYDVGQLSRDQMFAFFAAEHAGKPGTWSELSEMPAPTPNPRLYLQASPVAAPPVAEGTATLLSVGNDPLRGYWAEFAGNYFLTFPIFKDWAKQVIRDGPNFKGYQGQLTCPWHKK